MDESRNRLNSKLRDHAAALSNSLDKVDPAHRESAGRLAEWIAANHRPGQRLNVIVVCTGNSRRSILGSSMGNLAAAYHGLPEVRFFSGGTEISAFNSRTITALKSIGFEIVPTGDEAPRGETNTVNPVYRVSWGEGFETREFSKRYSDPANPSEGFAAMMICSEADKECPQVQGASVRIPIPFADPKAFDGTAFEAAKYAERRDDIGRVMLFVMQQVRERIDSKSKP